MNVLLPDLSQTFEPVRLTQATRLREKCEALRHLFPETRNELVGLTEFTSVADAALVDHLFYLALSLVKGGNSDALGRLDNALER